MASPAANDLKRPHSKCSRLRLGGRWKSPFVWEANVDLSHAVRIGIDASNDPLVVAFVRDGYQRKRLDRDIQLSQRGLPPLYCDGHLDTQPIYYQSPGVSLVNQ